MLDVRAGIRLSLLLALVMLPGGNAARAQPQTLSPAESSRLFQVFLLSPQFRAYLAEQVVKTEPPASLAECNRMTARLDLDAHRVFIDVPIAMAKGANAPVGGIWRHQIPVDRCGTMVRRTLLVQAQADGKLRAIQLLPGETIANVQLQIDALRAAVHQVAARTGCKASVRVTDTKVEQPFDEGRWTEVWTFSACGARTQRVVQFSPPASGPGTIYTVGDDPARAPSALPGDKTAKPVPASPARAKPAPAASELPKEDSTR